MAAPPGSVAHVTTVLYIEASKLNEAAMFYQAAFGFVARSATLQHIDLGSIYLTSSTKLFFGGDADITTNSDAPEAQANMSPILKTEHVDEVVARAVNAGAVQLDEAVEIGTGFKVKDPYGFIWTIISSLVV